MSEARPAFSVPDKEQELSLMLVRALVEGRGMNDHLSRFLAAIRRSFAAERLVLFDYYEADDVFDLLYFSGYPPDHRFELRAQKQLLDLRRALESEEPYSLGPSGTALLLPLYFQDTLEAVLVLETSSRPWTLDAPVLSACRIVSRFLGLFMSSSRLPVNQLRLSNTVNDLQRAREIQLTYLPAHHPVTEHYEIFGYNQSSALVGGDYFDYFCRREKTIQCIVADACGHGLSAALIMSTFRGLLQAEVGRAGEEDRLFTSLNRHLFSEGEILQYLTAVFLDYDETSRILRYFNAGHFDPLLIHADGSSTHLEGGGPPLGMFRESAYEERRTSVLPGDLIVLFTDGLIELKNSEEEFFGIDGVRQAFREHASRPLKLLAEEALRRAAAFSRDAQPVDDLTLFLMRFL